MIELQYVPLLFMVMTPPMMLIIGLCWLTLRLLKTFAPPLSRGLRVVIGAIVSILPFWGGYFWETVHPIILLRDPDGSVGLDEGWLIFTQLLFVVGAAGLVVAIPAAIILTRPERPWRDL